MIDGDTALAHQLLEIAIAYAIAAVPTDRPEHDLTLTMPPLEVRNGPVSPSVGTIRRTAARFATEPRSVLSGPFFRVTPSGRTCV